MSFCAAPDSSTLEMLVQPSKTEQKKEDGGGGTVFIGFVEGRGIERKTLVRDESSDGKKG